MDVLTDLLERSRARSAAFAHTTAHGEWGVRFATGPGMAVHVVVDGETYLWTDAPDAEAVRLLPGDLVIVRGALEHQMGCAPDATCVPLAEVIAAGSTPGSSRHYAVGEPVEGRPAAAVFFCGAYLFEGDLCDGLMDALPEVLHVRPRAGSSLRATLDLLAAELAGDAPGQQTLLDRLLDVALIQVVRAHLGEQGEAAPPWFRAESDPPIAAALRALHGDPARAWTVADLAAEAHLSRAAFARRFAAALGEAPLTYLTSWRMAVARERLTTSKDGLAAIADAVGYRSEFAFSAAFKRHHGAAPGRWRTRVTAG